VLVRAAVAALVSLGLAWLITAATDEGGVSWGERITRTLPLTPACGAIGSWIALGPVCARGEALALAALGRSEAQVVAAPVAGGAVVAWAAALATGVAPAIDIGAFFPRAQHASAWVWCEGAFIDRARGVLIGADGAPVHLAPEAAGVLAVFPNHGRAAAAIAIALAGLALPLLLARAVLARASKPRRGAGDARRVREDAAAVLASGAAVAASVVLFHASAARSVPALLGALPPLALLAFALSRYRESS
jgi:hypothetical protein